MTPKYSYVNKYKRLPVNVRIQTRKANSEKHHQDRQMKYTNFEDVFLMFLTRGVEKSRPKILSVSFRGNRPPFDIWHQIPTRYTTRRVLDKYTIAQYGTCG